LFVKWQTLFARDWAWIDAAGVELREAICFVWVRDITRKIRVLKWRKLAFVVRLPYTVGTRVKLRDRAEKETQSGLLRRRYRHPYEFARTETANQPDGGLSATLSKDSMMPTCY
jgi:hypothetical protein